MKQKKIVTDNFNFYIKCIDELAIEIFRYYRERGIYNINARSVTRNGFTKIPLGYEQNRIDILQEFCEKHDIQLVYTANTINSKGKGLSKLIALFDE